MTGEPSRAFIDLHCHTNASFDSLADPVAVARAAAHRGLTHVAITDHDRIDGALRARDGAPDGLTVIVGEEVKTDAGDLIVLFLERALPPGRPVAETIAAARAQGALVGVPHPFDRLRGSMGRAAETLEALAGLVDWVEAYNARVLGGSGNEAAALFARDHGLPGVGVSDAHSTLEVGVAYTSLLGDPSTAPGLLAALQSAQLVTGHASYFTRLITPVAKAVQRVRGNGRVGSREPGAAAMTDEPRDHRPMVDPPGDPVSSPPMQAVTPAAVPSARPTPSAAPDPAELADSEAVEQLSLGRRLRQPRTIVSIVLPLILLALLARTLPGFDLASLPGIIGNANPLLILAAVGVYYLGFPLRGWRWVILLRGTGYAIRPRDATEIIFLSWLVNCLVPAKLGDIYRAYLLKINSPVSLSRTFGTVFIERILDLFAIAVLGLGAGFVSFRTGLPPVVQALFAFGVAVVVILAAALLTMRNFGRRIILRLPLPQRIVDLYDRFEEGVFGAVALRQMPILLLLTALIWSTEAIRLFLVVEALGIAGVHLGISGSFFVALCGSLLTAVPLTPGGLGVVETGVVGILTAVYHLTAPQAVAITLVDRTISVLSIIVFGSIAYVLSPLRRGAGLRGAHEVPPATAVP